jgi:hypothetical protein
MPLSYETFIRGSQPASAAASLCSHCATRHPLPLVVPTEDNSWVLDLIVRIYRSGGTWQRLAAGLGCRIPALLPGKLLALARVVQSIPRRRTRSRYDAVVLYSGGKDSSWMLLQLARHRLRVCAWLLDQGYQSPTAIANAQRLCERLGVPLEIEKPEQQRMNDLFRFGFGITREDDPDLVRAAMTYGSACWPCFATIAARASVFCARNDVAFCFIGTQRGQNRLDLQGQPALAGRGLPRLSDLTSRFIEPLRQHVARTRPASAELLAELPARTVVLPFYEFVPKPAREEQIRTLEQVGWTMPNDVGACSSNCRINELGRQVMRTRFGFDLYQVIDAHERRMDLETVDPGPAAAGPPLDERAVVEAAQMIGLTPEEAKQFRVDLPCEESVVEG